MDWLLLISGILFSWALFIALIAKCRLRVRQIDLVIMVGVSVILSYWTTLLFSDLSFGFKLIFYIIFSSCVFLLYAMIHFFRDPDRTPPEEKNILLAPADGVVRYVHSIQKNTVPISNKKGRLLKINELLNDDMLCEGGFLIGIEMSLLDVHVNRSSVQGHILKIIKNHGKFISLRKMDSIFENERVTIRFDTGTFQIAIVQIASRLVRRIVSFCQEGDHVQIGQRIGRITFGSQVDVVIPQIPHLQILVKEGACVKAGLSILARYE